MDAATGNKEARPVRKRPHAILLEIWVLCLCNATMSGMPPYFFLPVALPLSSTSTPLSCF